MPKNTYLPVNTPHTATWIGEEKYQVNKAQIIQKITYDEWNKTKQAIDLSSPPK